MNETPRCKLQPGNSHSRDSGGQLQWNRNLEVKQEEHKQCKLRAGGTDQYFYDRVLLFKPCTEQERWAT